MRLSVIIPVLRRDAFFAECRANIGDDPDVEVIAIEGVSPVGSARNEALSRATGDWILFVDADDLLAPGWLTVVRGMIVRHPQVDMVGFGRSEKLPLEPCVLGDDREIDVSETLSDDIVDRYLWQYAYRRDLLRELHFTEFVRGEDRLFEGEALLRARRVAVCEAVLYGYRQHAASAMHALWSRQNVSDEIAWRVAWVRKLTDSGKTMSRRAWREMGLYLLEYIPYDGRQVVDPLERRTVRECWFAALAEVDKRFFSAWQRGVMRLLSVTRSRVLAWVLCRMPFELKRRTMFLRRHRT